MLFHKSVNAVGIGSVKGIGAFLYFPVFVIFGEFAGTEIFQSTQRLYFHNELIGVGLIVYGIVGVFAVFVKVKALNEKLSAVQIRAPAVLVVYADLERLFSVGLCKSYVLVADKKSWITHI